MTDTAMPLDGKRVVVIGGASGIGFAIAELARAQRAAVVIGSSDKANVSAATERLRGAKGRIVDLRDEARVVGFFDELGAFDHLAITAGDWRGSTFFASSRDLDLTKARECFTVRFWGALAAVKRGCTTIARDGSITLTSGMLAHRPGKSAPMATTVGERSNT
jgi:NAD(P)-dependent dehydrogenase (short-subunit alcohol dehydrogenase family)